MSVEADKSLLRISYSLNQIVKALVLIFWLLFGAATYGLIKIEHCDLAKSWLVPMVFVIWLIAVLIFGIHDGYRKEIKLK